MLIHEFKEQKKRLQIETRIYLDVENKYVELYQYTFDKDKVLDTNRIQIPIKQFGKITKSVLSSFIISQMSSY